MSPFGPLFREELNRLNRRNAVFLLRVALAGGLLAVIAVEHPGDGVQVGLARQAELARSLFLSLTAVQFAAVWFLTPLFAAAIITEERERKTLELLLAAPLTGWDLVAGKLFARLLFVGGVLLAGLPVMAMLRVFGGIAYNELALVYLGLFANLLGIGGFAAAIAASSQSYRVALYATWAGLGVCSCVPVFSPFPALVWMRDDDGPALLTAILFLAINALVGLGGLWFAVSMVRAEAPGRPGGPRERARHSPLALTPDLAKSPTGAATRASGLSAGIDWAQPPDPAEGPSERQVMIGGFVAAASLGLLTGLAAYETEIPPRVWPTFMILGWVPAALVVAVQTAGLVSREREAGTLMMLLTVPASRTEILWRKLTAAVTSHLWLAVMTAIFAGAIFLLSDGLEWYPGFLAQGVGLIAAAAASGLVLTVECRTTFLAQAAAVLTVLFLAVLPGWANFAASEEGAVKFVPAHYALLLAIAVGGWVLAAWSFGGYARR
jgi:ABC-type transport system involved in multi-copper enzyme maturation permease subunit